MGFLGRFFKKSAEKPVNSFDQVTTMTTRTLPIPGAEDNSPKFILVTATRQENDLWRIEGTHNGAPFTEGLKAADTAFRAITARHMGKNIADITGTIEVVDFDVAFKILREMEETLLKHCGYLPGHEPRRHFMKAYRVLPQVFQAEIDTDYFRNVRHEGWALPPANMMKPKSKSKPDPKP